MHNAFQPGDLVRSRDGDWLGVVLLFTTQQGALEPEVHVEMTSGGVREGVSIWSPSELVLAPDAASRAEATRLGLVPDEAS